MSAQALRETFQQWTGDSPSHIVWAPGRVNLIGEHIDYCGGEVMPMAISQGTSAVLRFNRSDTVRVRSLRFNETTEINRREPVVTGSGWDDYVAGVLIESDTTPSSSGFDMLIDQDIGSGGLSSSASFCVALALAARGESATQLSAADRSDLAQLCRRVENNHIGVACGIMDQMSVVLGGVKQLDCSTLAYQDLSPDFDDHVVVIMDSKVERTLAASKYNERVDELTQLSGELGVEMNSLANFETARLAAAERQLSPILYRRLRHVVTESLRVNDAALALNNKDWTHLGELLNQSHVSLRDDYEVSCEELDFLVDEAIKHPGVRGARMTGGGFGGCAIAFGTEQGLAEWLPNLKTAYQNRYAKDAVFTVAKPGEAAYLKPLLQSSS